MNLFRTTNRTPRLRLEESIDNLGQDFARLGRGDFVDRARDLDEGRPFQIPETPDLFADGLEIAQSVLDWEERAGQPITALLDHIKSARELRKSVTEKAEGGIAESQVST